MIYEFINKDTVDINALSGAIHSKEIGARGNQLAKIQDGDFTHSLMLINDHDNDDQLIILKINFDLNYKYDINKNTSGYTSVVKTNYGMMLIRKHTFVYIKVKNGRYESAIIGRLEFDVVAGFLKTQSSEIGDNASYLLIDAAKVALDRVEQ